MKKLLLILLPLSLIFVLAACAGESAPAEETPPPEPAGEPAPQTPEPEPETPIMPLATEVLGATIPVFEVFVNEVSVTHEMMAEYQMYSVQATAVNSSGTESTVTYIGFRISDVLDAAGLGGDYIWLQAMAADGYEVTVTGEAVMQDITLLATTQDGSPFNNGPWFAPCSSAVRGDYLKDMVSILANTQETPPDGISHVLDGGSASLPAGLPEILDRTDKVEFAPFSFLVNGQEVTNETLDGLSIYKITAVTENSAGEIRENGYTGYNLAAVLETLGLSGAVKVTTLASDDFEAEYIIDELGMDWVLVAIERDGETGEDGTIWFAPCAETSSRAFARDVVELIVE